MNHITLYLNSIKINNINIISDLLINIYKTFPIYFFQIRILFKKFMNIVKKCLQYFNIYEYIKKNFI